MEADGEVEGVQNKFHDCFIVEGDHILITMSDAFHLLNANRKVVKSCLHSDIR